MSAMKDAKIQWSCTAETAVVVLAEGIPAGTYGPEDAARLAAMLTDASKQALDGREVARWLTEAGVEPEAVARAVHALRERAKRQALTAALGPLSRGGLFG